MSSCVILLHSPDKSICAKAGLAASIAVKKSKRIWPPNSPPKLDLRRINIPMKSPIQKPADSSTDQLILVDSFDNEIGYETVTGCHYGNPKLHRAFSVFVFNDAGE